MIQIYHNPRCSKSRNGVALLESLGKCFTVVDYLNEPIDKETLKALVHKLKIAPIELVRKGESIWKEHYKGQELSDEQIIDALIKHPKLIERPIVVNGDKAVIGRPTENIQKLFN